ncbi:MAG: peptidoglycan-binding protein [Clostridia bacterium]|nr:peptidoglycan-binding protein [Clostridia bacterium]
MKQRKLPYVHILPRVLIGVLVFGSLLFLLYVPMVSRNILSVSELADEATPVPTATWIDRVTALPTAPLTLVPTLAPSADPTLPPSDVVTFSDYTTLRLGDDNASVQALQRRLTDLGYLDSDMPGSTYNESIASAVVLFQRSCNMEQTGVADNATQASLYGDQAQMYRIKRSDTGTDVLRLQQRLTELGYYDDRANGYFGPNTEQAVMMFQAINDLSVSGELDFDAWTILYSEDALPNPAFATDEPTAAPTIRSTVRRSASAQSAKPTKKTTPKATAKKTPKPGATATDRKTPTPKPTAIKTSPGKKTYANVVAAAQDQLGKPYVWSTEGPDSFDCSGLVYYCLKQSGHSVSRKSAKGFSQNGSWQLISSMSDLKAGDLVFFKSDSKDTVNHTGICISSSTMIHASSSKGKVVKSSLHQSYWERNFVCGRRPQ